MNAIFDFFFAFIVGAIFLGVLVALWLFANLDEKEFNARMAWENQACLSKGESEYTCKTYIASLRAQRSSQLARDEAASASAIGAVNLGLNSGGRK